MINANYPPRVLNRRKATADELADAVYVGRPSKFGNPFSHLPRTHAAYKVGTRREAVERYRAWILKRPALVEAAKHELRGRNLLCWCSPMACHADVLLEIANS